MADLGHGEPWPFDCVIGGMGLMLTHGPDRESPWVETKVKYFDPQSVMTAEDRTYAQFPPEIDFPKVQDTWKGGYGASHQQADTKERYAYSKYADCSSGHPQKGPELINTTQTLTGAPYQMITFTISGTEKVLMACGTRLYRRDDDTATGMVLVSNLGQTIGQMQVFRGTQTADFLFIPLGTGAVYQTMDSTGTLAAHATQKANGFVVAGDELFLWILENNQWFLKKTWTGGASTTWIGQYPVGDASASVIDAKMVAGRLMLGKSNGLYAVSALVAPLSEDVTPSLKPFNNTANCKGSVVFDENYVFLFDGGLMKYDPASGSYEQFGPETINDNQSDVKGQVSSVTCQDGLAIYATIYNLDNTTSYLGKWGTWDQGPESKSSFIPSWHFALHEWEDKQACMLQVVNLDWGTGAGRIPRIYVGFTDGTFQYFYASRTSNPADDPNYNFDTAHDGEVYLSRFTALFPFETKVLKQIGLVGHNLSGTKQIGAAYKIPTDTSYTAVGTVSEEPGEKLTPGGTPADKAFDIKVTLTNASNANSPKIDTVVIFVAIRFENLKEIVCWIDVSDGVLNRKGQQLRQRWQDIRNKIENTANLSGSVTVISPTGESLVCLAIEFGHALMTEDKEKKVYKWASRMRLVQTIASATRGTWDRAGLSTWDDLSAFTWDQVRVI